MDKNSEQEIAQLKRAWDIQKRARKQAEHLLEEKSLELYLKNQSLKEAFEQLNVQHQRLNEQHQELNQKNALLQQQQSQLVTQEKLAAVGQLGASLAHELNNPNAFIHSNLHTLDGYLKQVTQALKQSFALLEQTELKPEAQRHFANIRANAELDYIQQDREALVQESLQGCQRITQIANSLRYFANPEPARRRVLDVNECIKQAQTLVHHLDQLAQIHYQLADIPTINGLPMLLSQAIACLIQNALEAQAEQPVVDISTAIAQAHIVISIRDYGPGIDNAQLSQVFQPFYSSKTGRNGLGLSIAQDIVQQHGGHLSLQSCNAHTSSDDSIDEKTNNKIGSLAQIWLPLSNKADALKN